MDGSNQHNWPKIGNTAGTGTSEYHFWFKNQILQSTKIHYY